MTRRHIPPKVEAMASDPGFMDGWPVASGRPVELVDQGKSAFRRRRKTLRNKGVSQVQAEIRRRPVELVDQTAQSEGEK